MWLQYILRCAFGGNYNCCAGDNNGPTTTLQQTTRVLCHARFKHSILYSIYTTNAGFRVLSWRRKMYELSNCCDRKQDRGHPGLIERPTALVGWCSRNWGARWERNVGNLHNTHQHRAVCILHRTCTFHGGMHKNIIKKVVLCCYGHC